VIYELFSALLTAKVASFDEVLQTLYQIFKAYSLLPHNNLRNIITLGVNSLIKISKVQLNYFLTFEA
jgi:hypothetical protein